MIIFKSAASISLLLISSLASAQESPIKKVANVTAPIRLPGSPIYTGTPAPTDPAPRADLKPIGKAEEPLLGLTNTINASRSEIAATTFNPLARALSIPEQPATERTIFGIHQTVDGVRRGIMVRRLADPARTDVVMYAIRGDTMHIYQTGTDGLMVSAIQRGRDRTTRAVSGRDIDTAFRDEIQIWRNWERDYLRQLAQADANRK